MLDVVMAIWSMPVFGQLLAYDRTGTGVARDVNSERQTATEDEKNAKSLKKEN
ncbi:hypothetical protein [Acidovorax sp.]|uniref:hypothetical protein n=1 Tax=Acidovorax sp. TaxID=1872122 RepID=UPI002612E0CF|nr:hypothetical protein [Acidovorax sp.]